ncbi:MAG: asparagine synthetase B, partial [Bacteroidia bacterium]|nr:asparagine synthetase B [Bacteroidia bacterium]
HLSYIPAPYSIYENVWKLEPGEYFSIELNNSKEVKSEKWYTLEHPTQIKSQFSSYSSATNIMLELLEQSVESRLVSDVPVGTFLSGGIDSSAVTALASNHTSHLNTFTISFKDQPMFDESKYAELVASKYNTNHKTFELSSDLMLQHFDNILGYMDEPFADSSALAFYVLCNETQKHVKVALSGDGGDELFAGYNKYRAEYRVQHAGLAENIIKHTYPLFKILPQSRNSYFGNKARQIIRFGEGINMSNSDRYWRWAGYFKKEQLLGLFNKELLLKHSDQLNERIHKQTCSIDQNSGLESLLFADIYLTLQNDMMVKADRMSMANSLEVRVPFLDHRIVEFAQSLPIDYKIDKNNQKKILIDSVKKLLPSELFNRKKQGFEVPLAKWFDNELRGMIIEDYLNDEMIENQGIYDVDAVRKLKQKLFSSNPGDSAAQIWTILVFQYWAKSNLNKIN